MISKEVLFASDEYIELCKLRNEELRKPLGLTLTKEDKKDEEIQNHFGTFHNDQAIACVILKPLDEKTLKMRQVCTHHDFQGKFIGTKLLHFVEDWSRKNGYEKMLCHARETAVNFYLKQHYQVQGEVFEEVGIPHYYMEKKL